MTEIKKYIPDHGFLKNYIDYAGKMTDAPDIYHVFNAFIVMVLIAQLGHEALAASFTIAMTRIVMLVIFLSPLFAIGAIVGRNYSGQQLDETKNTSLIQQGWVVGLLLAITPIIILSFLEPILSFFHQPKNLIPLVGDYFKYYMWAIPAIYLATVNQQYLAGIKKQNYVMVLNLITFILSIFLNTTLIFGYLGFPKLGIEGAGIASLITAWTSFIISTVLSQSISTVNHKKLRLNNFNYGKIILKIGLPICLRSGSELLLMFVIMIMISWLGETAMSASQISNEYLLLASLPLFGLSEACAIVVGHTFGEQNRQELEMLNKAALLIATIFTLGVALIIFVFHRPLADAFIDFSQADAIQIYRLAMWLLAIRILQMLFSGPIQTYTGLLRGTYDTFFPMIMSLLTSWLITLPLAYVLGLHLKFGVIGIVVASSVAKIILAFGLWLRWKYILYNKYNLVSQA